MKKIGLITTNKLLAQSLAASIESYPDLDMETHLLLDPHQAALDAVIFKIDVAVVDVYAGNPKQASSAMHICEDIRRAVPGCRLLLLVPQADTPTHDMVMTAMKHNTIDDYVFCDVSLDYLLTKLLAL